MAIPEELRRTAWFYSQNTGNAKARAGFEQQLEIDGQPAVLVEMAEQFANLPDVAIPALCRLVELAQANVGYLVRLGFAYFSAGEDEEAEKCLRRAEALVPNDLEVMNLAATLARDDASKRAIYARILARFPDDRVAYENLVALRGLEDH